MQVIYMWNNSICSINSTQKSIGMVMLNTFYKIGRNRNGFTLMELLIAMVITTIVSAGIFSAYRSQQNAQLAQKQIVEMQQNLRAALYIMTSEIRMAGYDPDGTNGAGITKAGDGSNTANFSSMTFNTGNPFGFTFVADDDGDDNDNDGTTDESGELKTIEFGLYDGSDDDDRDLGRKVGTQTVRPLAENIATLNFTYFDSNGNLLGNPPADLSDIRRVDITITAATDANELDYTDGSGRTLSTTVKCRNLGL